MDTRTFVVTLHGEKTAGVIGQRGKDLEQWIADAVAENLELEAYEGVTVNEIAISSETHRRMPDDV